MGRGDGRHEGHGEERAVSSLVFALQDIFSTVGQVRTHCASSASTSALRRIQVLLGIVMENKQDPYAAGRSHEAQDWQFELPGPEYWPDGHALHSVAPG